MTPEERRIANDVVKTMPKEHRIPMLRWFDALYTLQKRISESHHALSPGGLIANIEDAQHAAQDFIKASQGALAYVATLGAPAE
jgi:hypothetical protein